MKKLFVVIIVVSMFLISCQKDVTQEKNHQLPVKSEAIVTLNGITNTLDVNIANFTNTSTIMYHVMDRLMTFDEHFNFEPAVIQSWEQTDDVTIRLTMNTNYQFHNGDPVSVDDVSYSIMRLKEIPQTASIVEHVNDIEILDDQTLILHLNTSKNNVMRGLVGSVVVVNKKLMMEQGDAYWKAPIGSGPFKFVSFVPGQEVILERWVDHPFKKAKLEKLTFKNIEDATSLYIALETGETDVINSIQFTDKDRAMDHPDIKVEEHQTIRTGFISMNVTKAPFDNVLVRRAIAHATDKESYALLLGDAVAIDSMVPSFITGYYSSEDMPSYDIEKAKALIAEAGYKEGIQIVCSSYSADTSQIELLQADLKKIGVEMTIENLEFGVFLDKVLGAEYEILFGSWGNTNGDVADMLNCYSETSLAESNISFYTNSELESYYKIATETIDENQRLEAVKKIQLIAAKDVPMIPTTSGVSRYGIRKNLMGVKIDPVGYIDLTEAYFE